MGDLVPIRHPHKKPHKLVSGCRDFLYVNALSRTRTCDLLLRRRWTTTASNSPLPCTSPAGIEPATYCLGGSRSIQLSYGDKLWLYIHLRPVAPLILDGPASHAVSAMMNVAVGSSVKRAEIRSLPGTSSSIRSAHRRRSASRHIP